MCRKVHDRVDLVLGDEPRHQGEIADVSDDEFPGGDRLPKAFDEVVEDDDLFGRFAQLPDHVATDVAGAAGDQNCPFSQNLPPSPESIQV